MAQPQHNGGQDESNLSPGAPETTADSGVERAQTHISMHESANDANDVRELQPNYQWHGRHKLFSAVFRKTPKDLIGRRYQVGDKVVRIVRDGSVTFMEVATVTAIRDNRVFVNDSITPVVYPGRMMIVTTEIEHTLAEFAKFEAKREELEARRAAITDSRRPKSKRMKRGK